jgi:deoxyribonuclease-4
MTHVKLGPAGTPAGSTIEGVSKVKELGLHSMEVQFSHGVGMGLPLAKRIGEERKRVGIELSVHAPYYINLASDDKKKIEESKKRILDSCERAHLMGASPVVFHPAYFGTNDREKIFQTTRDAIIDLQKTVKKNKWHVELAPETTGKHSALGSLDETIRLVKETGCGMCVDFAHLYARRYGKIDYADILDKVKPLKQKPLHTHFSNINFTQKGERNHLVLDHSPDFTPLAKEIIRSKTDINIICESPITWKDSLKMRKIFERLGHKF